MAMLNFNASNVAPQESFTPIPAGIYIAQITDSDIKALKNGNGQSLAMTFDVLDGQYKGRKVFARLNVQHNNPQAEQIAQKQLSQLCHAIGVMQVADSAQLHNRPMKIKVKIRKDDTGQYNDQNEISAFESIGNAAPMAQSGFIAPTKPAAFSPAPQAAFVPPQAATAAQSPWGAAA